jgi:hypothetical protein
MLPPTPAAVAAYFAQRRGTLSELTPEDARHNDRLWLVGACGLSESEAEALLTSDQRPAAAMPLEPSAEAAGEGNGLPGYPSTPALSVTRNSAACATCGSAFRARRSTARFCTTRCRMVAHRRVA